MKKWQSIIITIVLLIASVVPTAALETGEQGAEIPEDALYVEGQALAKVKLPAGDSGVGFLRNDGYSVSTLINLSKYEGCEEESYESGGAEQRSSEEFVEKILLIKTKKMSTEELLAALQEYDEIEYAEPNYKMEPAAIAEAPFLPNDRYPNDPYYERDDETGQRGQWALQDEVTGSVKVEDIWKSSSVADVEVEADVPVVAIVDTGIDHTHEDLAGSMWKDTDPETAGMHGFAVAKPDSKDPDATLDPDGHGTHVAGIIGAQMNNGIGVAGVNRQVKLMAVRVTDEYGFWATTAEIVQGFKYVLDKKAEGVNIIAANNSWGSYEYSRIYEEMLDEMGDNGIVTVIASGNEAIDHDINHNTPEGGDRSMQLIVNASDPDGEMTWFSDYGLYTTDLFAPGLDIMSTFPKDNYDAEIDIEKSTPVVKEDFSESPLGDDSLENGTISSWASKGAVLPVITYDENKKSISFSVTANESTVGKSFGIEWKPDIPGDKVPVCNHLLFGTSITNTKKNGKGRFADIYLKTRDENNPWVYAGDLMAEYERLSLSEIALADDAEDNIKDKIDWDDFTVRITTEITSYDIDKEYGDVEYTYSMNYMAVTEKIERKGYLSLSGTSMAAPVVTGSVALLYDYYDVVRKAAEVKTLYGEQAAEEYQYNKTKEIRARIAGGVVRTEEMVPLCSSGGYLDLTKAVTSPYPVLDSVEQDGNIGTLKGYFFGSEKGILMLDGGAVDVISWSCDTGNESDTKAGASDSDGTFASEIVFKIPEGTDEGLHEFKVICKNNPDSSDNSEQYGRDKLWLDEVASEPSGNFFEKLKAFDYSKAPEIKQGDNDSDYSVAAHDGKIYVTRAMLHGKDSGEEKFEVLVYDEKTREWSDIKVDSVGKEISSWLLGDNDELYLVREYLSEEGDVIQVSRKKNNRDEFEVVNTEVIDNGGEYHQYSSAVYDGENIWIISGEALWDWLFRSSLSFDEGSRLLKYNVKNNTWSKEKGLKFERKGAAAEVVGDKLVITGGVDADTNEWITETEIIDIKTGERTEGAPSPEVYKGQYKGVASGKYQNKMIITGMFDSKEHNADTYVYDVAGDTWEASDIKLMDAKVTYLGGDVLNDHFYVYGIVIDGDDRQDVFRRTSVSNLPDGPIDPDEPDDPGKPDGPGEKDPADGADTGDDINMAALYSAIAAMLIASAVITTAFLSRRKNYRCRE